MCKYWLKRAEVKDFWKTSQPILITLKVEMIDNFMPFVEKRMVHDICNRCFFEKHNDLAHTLHSDAFFRSQRDINRHHC